MSDTRLKMWDPRTQYLQPPFKQQHQSQPGLAKEMDPHSDHGETSYIGSSTLKGRKALMTGASSTFEYAYGDACAATMARALGKDDDAELFARRAQS